MTDPRRCRMCGQPIEARRIVYGRQAGASDWWVHLHTERVPCEPVDRTAHEANLRAAGILKVSTESTVSTLNGPPSLSENHESSHKGVLEWVDSVDTSPEIVANKGETPPSLGGHLGGQASTESTQAPPETDFADFLTYFDD